MNTPKQTAMNMYDSEEDYIFDRWKIGCLPDGQIIELPHLVLWGFPIELSSVEPGKEITFNQKADNPDTWVVWLFVGDLKDVLEAIPFHLPNIVFARRGNLRNYDATSLLQRIQNMKRSSPLKWSNQLEQQHQFGGGKPSQSKVQKENEMLNNELLKQQLAAAKAGAPELPAYEIPKAEIPVYAPPPTATSADAEAAAQEFKRQQRARRGFQRSKLGAGDTGGITKSTPAPTSTAQGTKTKLA
jgi:hypothetical protein